MPELIDRVGECVESFFAGGHPPSEPSVLRTAGLDLLGREAGHGFCHAVGVAEMGIVAARNEEVRGG
jgi:hypothetical protein